MRYSGLGGEAPGDRAGTASQGSVAECGHNSAIRAGDDSVHSILRVAWDSSVGRVSPAGVDGGFGELRDDPTVLAQVVAARAGTECKSHRSFMKYDRTQWECDGAA